jgi:hypothetical protein
VIREKREIERETERVKTRETKRNYVDGWSSYWEEFVSQK